MSENHRKMSQIEVSVRHSPLAYFYELSMPTISINGQRHRREWGAHLFEVTPGTYEVSASYSWLLSECGKNTVRITLEAGESKKVTYTAGLIRFLPGKIVVE